MKLNVFAKASLVASAVAVGALVAPLCAFGSFTTAWNEDYTEATIHYVEEGSEAYVTFDAPVNDPKNYQLGSTHTYGIQFSDATMRLTVSNQCYIGTYGEAGDEFTGNDLKDGKVTLSISHTGWQNISLSILDAKGYTVPILGSKAFYVQPTAPTGLKFTTTYNSITITAPEKGQWGDTTRVTGNEIDIFQEFADGSGASQKISGVAANTSYSFDAVGYYAKDVGTTGDEFVYSEPATLTVKTGPSTKPVIKTVKVTSVKATKSGKKYTTSWAATVTLSKKASGIKGIVVNGKGIAATPIKGSKTSYKITGKITGTKSLAGSTQKLSVTTYSDDTCGAYSPASKAVSYKLKK